jgi:hypothetical protein
MEYRRASETGPLSLWIYDGRDHQVFSNLVKILGVHEGRVSDVVSNLDEAHCVVKGLDDFAILRLDQEGGIQLVAGNTASELLLRNLHGPLEACLHMAVHAAETGPIDPGHYCVIVMESNGSCSHRQWPSLADSRAHADAALSETVSGESEMKRNARVAGVFDSSLALVYEGCHREAITLELKRVGVGASLVIEAIKERRYFYSVATIWGSASLMAEGFVILSRLRRLPDDAGLEAVCSALFGSW